MHVLVEAIVELVAHESSTCHAVEPVVAAILEITIVNEIVVQIIVAIIEMVPTLRCCWPCLIVFNLLFFDCFGVFFIGGLAFLLLF